MGIFNGTEEEKKYKLLIKAIKTSKKNNEIISYLITYLENVRNNKINNDFIEFDTLESVVIELINMNIENVSELKQHFDNFVKIFKIIMPAGIKTPNYEFKKNMFIFNFISVNGLIGSGLFNERIYLLFENDGDYLFFMNLIKNDTSLLNKVETIHDYMCRVAPFCPNGTILKNELISYIHAIDTVVGDLESFTNERIKEAKKRAGIYPINEKTLATISAEAEKAQALVIKLENLQKEVDDYSEIVLNRTEDGLSTIQSATLDGKNEIEKLSSFTIKTMQDYIAKVKKDIVSQLDEYLKSLEETLKVSSDKVFNQVLIDAQEKIRSIKIAAEALTNTTTTELIRIQQASEESVSKLKSYVENAPQVQKLLEQAKSDDKLRETLLSLKAQGQAGLVNNEKQVGIHIPGNDRIIVPANPKVVVPSQMEDIKILPAFDESIPFDVRMKKILEEKKRREHNGEIFHEMTEEVLRCVMEGDWVYLWGPSGCGKSYVIKQVASLLGIDMIDNGKITDKYSIMAYNDPHGRFRATQAFVALTFGKLLSLDEFDNGNTDTQVVLNELYSGLLDTLEKPEVKRYVTFAEDMTVPIHPNFRMVSAGNTRGEGENSVFSSRGKIDESVQERMTPKKFEYDNRVEQRIFGDNHTWYELFVNFRRICDDFAKKEGLDTPPGIVTTRDAAAIVKYIKHNSKSVDQVLREKFVQTKSDAYLKFIVGKLKDVYGFTGVADALGDAHTLKGIPSDILAKKLVLACNNASGERKRK